MSGKLTKLRFTIQDDLILLREALTENPFENSSRWKVLHKKTVQEMSKDFTLRAVREHVEHLLKLFKYNDFGNLRKGGTAEQYEEKEQLLRQLADLKNEFAKDSSMKRDIDERAEWLVSGYTHSEDSESVHLDRDAPSSYVVKEEIESCDESENVPADEQILQVSTSKPTNASNGTKSVMTNRNDRFRSFQFKKDSVEDKFKERELELNERKIAIEERKVGVEERKLLLEQAKFDLEKLERERRLEVELEERRHRISIEKQCQEMNSLLVKQLLKN